MVGGYRVVVGSDGYDAATVREVVHTLQVVQNPKNRASYWTLATAFG